MRTTRTLPATLSIAALAAAGVLVAPLAANAAPGDDILVFSHPDVVDTTPGSEVEWISAAMTAKGYDLNPFDGGDGSAAAWEAALEDIEVFVVPEQELGAIYPPDAPGSWMSEAAKDALVDWIRGGGRMLLSGACDPWDISLLDEAVGIDYSSVAGCGSFETAARWIDDDTLPESLPYANGTYTMTLGNLTEEQLAPLTVWYSAAYENECTGEVIDELAVGTFAAGDGQVAIEAWDYYNDDSPGQADWNDVLDSLLNGNDAASTWAPAAPASGTKAPVTATTSAGEPLYTISPWSTCEEARHSLFRVDPGTALAAPVGDSMAYGFAVQGAWNAVDETAYFPMYLWDDEEVALMTVDTETGAFTKIAAFNGPDVDDLDEIFSLAIGPDGAAYLFAEVEVGDEDEDLNLYSVNLETAALTYIATIDDSLLDEPNGFAAHPATGEFYAFEEDSFELFRVNVANGALTALGVLSVPSADEEGADVTSLQIGADGTFWAVYEGVADEEIPWSAGMLVRFTLADISGDVIPGTEVGIITDGPIPSWSLLLIPGEPTLPATGADSSVPLGAALVLLALGGLAVGARTMRRRAAA